MEKGFYFTIKDNAFYMPSNSKQITKKIIFRFIDAATEYLSLNPVLAQRVKDDPDSIKKLRQMITPVDFETCTEYRDHYTFYGKGLTLNYPWNDFPVVWVEP